MTSGSSQGLFVIVAVVIFGIFVLISYVLFRDNLKTGLATVFNDSIAFAHASLHDNILLDSEVYLGISNDNKRVENFNEHTKFIFDSEKDKLNYGLKFSGEKTFKQGEWYRISYFVEVLSGEVTHIGGHINGSNRNIENHKNFTINGENSNNGFYCNGTKHTGTTYATLDGSGKYKVTVDVLATNSGFTGGNSDDGFWIQMNRGKTSNNYKVEISDFRAYQL